MNPLKIFSRRKSQSGKNEGELETKFEPKDIHKHGGQKYKKASSSPARKNIVQIIDSAEGANIPMYAQSLETQTRAYVKSNSSNTPPEIGASDWGDKFPEATPESIWRNQQWVDRQAPSGEEPLYQDDNTPTTPSAPSTPPRSQGLSKDKRYRRRHQGETGKGKGLELEPVVEEHEEPDSPSASVEYCPRPDIQEICGHSTSDKFTRTNDINENGAADSRFNRIDNAPISKNDRSAEFEASDLNLEDQGQDEIEKLLNDIGSFEYSPNSHHRDFDSGVGGLTSSDAGCSTRSPDSSYNRPGLSGLCEATSYHEESDNCYKTDEHDEARSSFPLSDGINRNKFWPEELDCDEYPPRAGDEPDLRPATLNAYRSLVGDPKMVKPWVPEGLNESTFFERFRGTRRN